MRIAVWHNLPHGGASRALYDHLNALLTEGHYLEIWTSDMHHNKHLNFEKFGPVHIVPFNAGLTNLYGLFRHPASIFQTQKVIQALKEFQKRCAEQINAKEFDLVFVNSCSISYMPYISKFLTKRSIVYLGEPYRWLYEAAPVNGWQAPNYKWWNIRSWIKDFFTAYSRRLQVREEIAAAREYSKILVNSYYSKESVLKAYGIEAEVCRLGIDTDVFKTDHNDEKSNFVISVGFLYHSKGADRAIYLLSKLHSTIRPKFYWIGNGADATYLDQMKAYAKSLEVDFVPLIDITNGELRSYMARAMFMIYTPRLEPLGLAPLEVNACGTFVIGLAEAGVRETITHDENGFLIDGIHDDRFISYAELLLKDKQTACKLGLQARSFVSRHWGLEQLKQNLIQAISVQNTKQAIQA